MNTVAKKSISGDGNFLLNLLKKDHTKTGLLLNSLNVIDGATQYVHEQGLISRVRFMEDNLTSSVRVGGYLYIFRRNLLNYSDELIIQALTLYQHQLLCKTPILIICFYLPESHSPDY